MKKAILLLFILLPFFGFSQAKFNDSEPALEKPLIQYDFSDTQYSDFSSWMDAAKKKDTANSKTDTTDFKDKVGDFMVKYMVWGPFPIVSFASESGWLFGLTKFNSFTIRNHDTTDTVTQSSTVTGLAYVTTKGQYKFVLASDIMFYKNKYLWTTAFVFENLPLQFYGVGNDTKLEDKSILTTQNLQITTRFSFKTWKKVYIGIRYDFFNYYKVALDTTSNGEDSLIINGQTGIQSGLGPSLRWENRDNRFNAKKGTFLRVEYEYYGKYIGSQYEYSLLIADFRYYITPLKWLTIAMQGMVQYSAGDVPVQSLALMGGSSIMRGVYEGRYRDKTMLQTQLELRFPIYWVFGGVVFGGMGQVGPEFGKYGFDRFRFTGGAGLRIQVDPVNDINLRIDFGFSKDFTGIYFGFSEAF